jgi:hypothetical protein
VVAAVDTALSGDQKQIFGGIGQDHVQKLPILRVVVTGGGTAYRVRLSADQIFQRLDWTFLGRCRRL